MAHTAAEHHALAVGVLGFGCGRILLFLLRERLKGLLQRHLHILRRMVYQRQLLHKKLRGLSTDLAAASGADHCGSLQHAATLDTIVHTACWLSSIGLGCTHLAYLRLCLGTQQQSRAQQYSTEMATTRHCLTCQATCKSTPEVCRGFCTTLEVIFTGRCVCARL